MMIEILKRVNSSQEMSYTLGASSEFKELVSLISCG